MARDLLSVRDLVASYGRVRALRGVSLAVREGQIVAVVGANGAGKTTLLKTLSGLLRSTEGSIEFLGEAVEHRPASHRVRRGLVLVPEGRQVLTRMTVAENLLMGAYVRRDRARLAAEMEAIYERFPVLRTRKDQPAAVLSGGEQQMLAIARALMSRPRLLMLDEPSLGLAPLLVEEVLKIVVQLRQANITVLLVEQNARQALEIADWAYVLETGRLVTSGTGAELLEDRRIQEAYLGIGVG